jgi:hypothetical protein
MSFLKLRLIHLINASTSKTYEGKVHAHNRPQGHKGVPGRLRPRIFLTFGTTRVVGLQPHASAAFTPRGIPWNSFLEAESTPGHVVPLVATEKIPSVTPPGIDPETVRLVAHHATPRAKLIHRINRTSVRLTHRIVGLHYITVICKLGRLKEIF